MYKLYRYKGCSILSITVQNSLTQCLPMSGNRPKLLPKVKEMYETIAREEKQILIAESYMVLLLQNTPQYEAVRTTKGK